MNDSFRQGIHFQFPWPRWITTSGPSMLVLAMVLSTTVAHAAPIEYHYGGVITSADSGSGITPGSRFDGTFTYDPQTNPLAMMIENMHSYEFGTTSKWPEPPAPDTSAVSLWVGGNLKYARQGSLDVSVSDVGENTPGDPFPHTTLNIHSYDIDSKTNIDLVLSNSSRSVFGSLDIPTAINLADFPIATLSATKQGAIPGTYFNYQGTIDTLSPVNQTITPEPTTIALWLGLAASAWTVQFKHKHRSRGRR